MRVQLSLAVAALLFLSACQTSRETTRDGGARPFLAGSYVLPHGERYTTNEWQLVKRDYIRFEREFRRVPEVVLAVRSAEIYTRKVGTFYQVKAAEVTTQGFELQIFGAYAESFSFCVVDWLAFEP